jgi:uncharacterized protein (TIGR03067 family)
VLSAGSLAAVVSQNSVSAAVPASLMSSTVKAATLIAAGQAMFAGVVPAKVALLTEVVLKAMLITKLKVAAAALLVVVAVGTGGGLLSRSTTAVAQTAKERLHKEAGEQRPDQQPPKATREGGPTELRNGSLIFGVGVNSDAGLTGSVVVNERNVNTGVGPDINDFKDGGDFLLLNSLEYQIPVRANDQVYAAPFADSGTVGSSPGPAETKAVAPRTDLDRLQGVWSVVSIEQRGGKPSRLDKAVVFMVDGNKACWQASDWEMQGGLYLDPTRSPRAYDLATSARTIEGIYSLEGDTLRLCYDTGAEAKRPVGFVTKMGSQQVLAVLKRTHGPGVFPFRLPDGTRAFPTVIEKANTAPPQVALVPPPSDLNAFGAAGRPNYEARENKKVRDLSTTQVTPSPPRQDVQRYYAVTSRLVKGGAGQPETVLSSPRLALLDGQPGKLMIDNGPKNLPEKVILDVFV